MKKYYFPLLLIALFANPLTAQVEVDLQLAWLRTSNEPQPLIANLEPAGQFSVGGDVLIGGGHLVPQLGAFFQRIAYREGEVRIEGNQLALPLGLAYRLREASTSFNLVGVVNLVPAFVLSEFIPDLPTEVNEPSFQLQGRLGLALYLDYLTLHLDWWIPTTERWEATDAKVSFTTLGLGVRF